MENMSRVMMHNSYSSSIVCIYSLLHVHMYMYTPLNHNVHSVDTVHAVAPAGA